MSPMPWGNWGPPNATLGDFPKLFDHWAQPRSTANLYRLSANCQPTLEADSSTLDGLAMQLEGEETARRNESLPQWSPIAPETLELATSGVTGEDFRSCGLGVPEFF
jgi:hypothetical protein